MFATRLSALEHPDASTFPEKPNLASCSSLAAWLEDRFIRQLPTEDRGPLRGNQPEALVSYLYELVAPPDLVADAEQRNDYAPVCSWLINLALQYDYGDKRAEYEAAAATIATQPSCNDPELLDLARALKVTPGSDVITTLQAVLKAARARPRPSATAAPAPKRIASTASSTDAQMPQPHLAGLSEETFPLGFPSTGKAAPDDAARVLRMLHVRELRRLQDAVNAAIVCMQEFTANPRTDARLGRVGR